MRGRKSQSPEGTKQYHLDDAFTTFDGISNTPKYWQKVKYDMIAKLENLGPFHLFFTLSCGDARYDENFSFFLNKNGQDKYAKLKKKILLEDVDDSMHEMIEQMSLWLQQTFSTE